MIDSKKLMAVFMIVLVLSTSVLGAGLPGVQNGVIIMEPIIEDPGNSYSSAAGAYLINTTQGITLNVCSEFRDNCDIDCDKRLDFVDVYRLTKAQVQDVYTEEQLFLRLMDGPDTADTQELIGYYDGTANGGRQCFPIIITQLGYYRLTVGAFGSPQRGGVSEKFATTYIRVVSTLACHMDGKSGQLGSANQYVCNADNTYQKCKGDGMGYEESGHCKTACGAIYGCEGMKPNPSCATGCVSDDGKYTVSSVVSGDTTTVTIRDKDGRVTTVVIRNGQIVSTTVDDSGVNSQNDPSLQGAMSQYNQWTYDTTVPKTTNEQNPGVDVLGNGLNITSLKIGDSDQNLQTTQFQKVKFSATIKGKANANVSIMLYITDKDGKRTQVYLNNTQLDSNGQLELSGYFYPLVPDGNYKVLMELHQDKAKRDAKWWVSDKPEEGLLVIAFSGKVLAESVNLAMEKPTSELLSKLFEEFKTARKENGIESNETIKAFKAFMAEYLKTLYPNEADYKNAMGLLSDERILDTLRNFDNAIKSSDRDELFGKSIAAADEIFGAYKARMSGYEKNGLATLKEILGDLFSFNFINLIKSVVQGIPGGETDRRKAVLEYKIQQITDIRGSLSLGRGKDFGQLYPLAIDPKSTNEQLGAAMGTTKETEITKLRRPFNDFVMSRDIMKSIYDDEDVGVDYGQGWMYFYSVLTVYDGSATAYTDYPLELTKGGSVDITTYSTTPKKQHDSLARASATWSLGNIVSAFGYDEADVEIWTSVYKAATNAFVQVSERGDAGEYKALAEERLGEIRGIMTRQNILKAAELVADFALGMIAGGWIGKGANVIMKWGKETAGTLGKVISWFGTALRVAKGVSFIYNFGRMAVECPRYLFGLLDSSKTSEADKIMAAGEFWPKCVASGINLYQMGKNILDNSGDQTGLRRLGDIGKTIFGIPVGKSGQPANTVKSTTSEDTPEVAKEGFLSKVVGIGKSIRNGFQGGAETGDQARKGITGSIKSAEKMLPPLTQAELDIAKGSSAEN